ncbi:MarR family winged helix-turn-helix transcriptional regulator [Microbacterium sp. SLBN-146]|uniref:MarR family winged helix-turn-helix transcriptional regulator n=1 Tax=Microbacterium sp. SLBN-146 TaxID=2768457 RepID=UPI001154DFD5|nr:MarR family transcriptional regulator [Microbacterium sp. SLBN-146]TQJ30105.1 MarR family protein [Microbacterium sp. SLBN-146]
MTDAEIVDSPDTRALVDAYRRFRAADAACQARIRASTHMGENEIRLVRYLVDASREGHDVMPSEITRHLGISSASTTAILDRLERTGVLERLSHPTDRRSILIAPTAAGQEALSRTVDVYEALVEDAVSSLDQNARSAVLGFLGALTNAADGVAVPESA